MPLPFEAYEVFQFVVLMCLGPTMFFFPSRCKVSSLPMNLQVLWDGAWLNFDRLQEPYTPSA